MLNKSGDVLPNGKYVSSYKVNTTVQYFAQQLMIYCGNKLVEVLLNIYHLCRTQLNAWEPA
jgi:hypothetical protein